MILYLIVPCFNEQEILLNSAELLKNKMLELINKELINKESKILFIDDGSRDKTWDLIKELYEDKINNNIFAGIKLSRNRGHQNALLAGLLYAKDFCDACISLDADLQDDIEVIDLMLDKYLKEDCEIIYGVRESRKSDSFFKRASAELFYKLIKFFGARDIIFNHADFRLMSKKSLIALESFKESNLFLRGVIPLIGFKSSQVNYTRKKRLAGKTKYSLTKMLVFALDGITSLSTGIIKIILILSLIIFLISLVLIFISGFNILSSLWLLSSINLFCLYILGEYISRIYLETKERPKFFIDKILN